MLSYLRCEEDDFEVVSYLESKHGDDLRGSSGRQFLRSCKFGTLQYCLVRPLTAIIATILEILGAYGDGCLSFTRCGYPYLMIIINVSVAWAFLSLASFYSKLKAKLAPFHPFGKFLCIKLVIFFSFWQGLFLSLLAHLDLLSDMDAIVLQNYLICLEMAIVSLAHLRVFPVAPFLSPAWGGSGAGGYVAVGVNDDYDPEAAVDKKSKPVVAPKNSNNNNKRSSRTRPSAAAAGLISASAASLSAPSSRSKDSPDNSNNKTSTSMQMAPEPLTYSPFGEAISKEEWKRSTAKQRATLLEQRLLSSSTASLTAPSTRGMSLDAHFATDSAIRDFNEAMPVLVLPTGFNAKQGKVVRSDPQRRLLEMQEQSQPFPKGRK